MSRWRGCTVLYLATRADDSKCFAILIITGFLSATPEEGGLKCWQSSPRPQFPDHLCPPGPVYDIEGLETFGTKSVFVSESLGDLMIFVSDSKK